MNIYSSIENIVNNSYDGYGYGHGEKENQIYASNM